jgi:hypothetical protein
MTGKFIHGNLFRKAFESNCIKLLVSAYHKTIMSNLNCLDWEENDITAQLYEYIDADPFRLKKRITTNVESILSNNSLPKRRGYAAKYSRIDMRFVVFRNNNEYKYFAEAKLLKERDSKLKRRYIKTGIDNFTNGKYYNGCLIAYIVEGILINAVDGVNKLLKMDHRDSEILIKNTCNYHNEYYESMHSSIGILKHYMFDFTNYDGAQA